MPVLNITKTRLNDPNLWFLGTNDQPGDYRQSGCAACHVIYANDRDPSIRASMPRPATTAPQTADPTIDQDAVRPSAEARLHPRHTEQSVHGLPHAPAQHVHEQLSRLHDVGLRVRRTGHVAEAKQQYPSIQNERARYWTATPKERPPRGKWADVEFLKGVADLNPKLKDTQFADYHGHGWNFRAVFKRDRAGNLLDAKGNLVNDDDPQKFQKAVHLGSIARAMSACSASTATSRRTTTATATSTARWPLRWRSAARTATARCAAYPNLYTSGPAALGGGVDLLELRTPDGRRRFEWIAGQLYQRSMADPQLEWKVSLVKDTVTPGIPTTTQGGARQAHEHATPRTRHGAAGDVRQSRAQR